MIEKTRSLIVALGLFVIASSAMAQPEAEVLFRSNQTVSATIAAPWREIRRSEGDQGWPAKLTWTDNAGTSHTLDLEVERRGISRLRVCEFPPIRLRFDKRVKEEGLFNHQKSLKLVTHCDDNERWQQYYILEMLAYRFYNLMTDDSFRVRPLEIVYLDVNDDDVPEPRFGFVIEDDSAVAKRNGMKKLDIESTRANRLEPLEASRLALFQLMIGNLDWSPLTGPDSFASSFAWAAMVKSLELMEVR